MIIYKKFIVTCEKKTPTPQEIDNGEIIKKIVIRSPEIIDNFRHNISESVYNILDIKETRETLETTCFTGEPFIDGDYYDPLCFVTAED